MRPDTLVRGRVRVTVRDASGRVVARRVFSNLETQWALNSLASWLVGGAGVVAPAAPAYLAFGLGPTNLLSADAADFEASLGGWAPASNCTLARSQAQAWHGASSCALNASSAASMTATSPAGTAAAPVTADYQYAASAHLWAAASARQVGVNIAWYDSTGTLLSTSTGATVADSTSAWTRAGVLAVAPANASYAAVQAVVVSPASGEVHYLDGVQLAYAPDGPMGWQPGYTGSAWAPVTPAVTDTQLSQERYLTRAQIDTGFAQQALAVLLHTYQQSDPSGSFSEAGLFDAAASTTASLSSQTAAGAASIGVSGATPALAAGAGVYIVTHPLASPTVSSFSGASTSGGYLVGGDTYYYKLTATNAIGETIPGTEASYAVPSGTSTNQVTLNWAAVPGATGYKVYRGTSSGGELLLASLGNVTSYVDSSNTTPAGNPPSADTSGGQGEYATLAAAAVAGATSWTLADTLLYAHPAGATVCAFTGNLWAHVALSAVAKTSSQQLSLQWELSVANAS